MSSFFPTDVLLESFTFPLFDFSYNADHSSMANSFMKVSDTDPNGGRRGLYVHIPFCDTICDFCPFVKSVGTTERIEKYLRALTEDIKRTASTARAQSWVLDAIYIGGGTPSVLSPTQATALIYLIKKEFTLRDKPEITFEVEAKSASNELLVAIAEAGVTRISFGIQTLDEPLRKIVNLTASYTDIERTIITGNKLFEDVNVDMIVGFPGQSTKQAMDDLTNAIKLNAKSMSLYPMDYVTVLPKLLNRMRCGTLPKPAGSKERWNMFNEGRDILKSVYSEQNMYCFGKQGLEASEYMFQILYGGYHDQYIGVGSSAYSSIGGILFHNHVSEEQYVDSALTGKSLVQRSSPGHGYEKELVFFPKRLSIDLTSVKKLGLFNFYNPRVSELEARGWATINDSSLKLTELGKRHYYQIMIGFFMDDQRRIYNGACNRLARDLGLSSSGELLESQANVKGMGTAISLNAGKTRGKSKIEQ